MFSRRVQEEEPPKPKLHVFGIEGDDLGGLMHQCRERDPRLRRNAEDKAKAAISPFVELRCAGQTFRTSRQSHDIDPVWPDASFFFGGDGEHEPLEPDDDGQHVVECVVFSSGVLRPREIGRARIPYHGECAPWLNKGHQQRQPDQKSKKKAGEQLFAADLPLCRSLQARARPPLPLPRSAAPGASGPRGSGGVPGPRGACADEGTAQSGPPGCESSRPHASVQPQRPACAAKSEPWLAVLLLPLRFSPCPVHLPRPGAPR